MSQQGQGSSSLPPKETPAKRKRGRPRKDENNQGQAEKKSASESAKNVRETTNTDDTSDDEMLGKEVTGVILGTFDAGYLVNFRVNGTDMSGLLFQPGKYVPITPENDVAPNVRMYHRKLPIPSVQNPTSQGQVNNNTKPVAVNPVRNENQTAAAVGELKDAKGVEKKKDKQKTDGDTEAGKKEPENPSVPTVESVMSEPKVEDRQALSSELKPDELVREEVKCLEMDKRTNMEVDVTKESGQTTAASLVITTCAENVNQSLSSELKPNEPVSEEVKGHETDKRTDMEVDVTKGSGQIAAASLGITPCVENVNQGPQVEIPILSSSDVKPNESIHSAMPSLSIDFTQCPRGISQGSHDPVLSSDLKPNEPALSSDVKPDESVHSAMPSLSIDFTQCPRGISQGSHDSVLSSDLKPNEPAHDGTNANVQATQQSGKESAPLLDFLACPVIVNLGPQIAQQALTSDLKPDEVVQNEVKSLCVDEQGTDMVTKANLKSGPASPPLLDFMPSIENVKTQEPPIGDQAPSSDLKPDEVKSPGIDDLGKNVGIEANKELGPDSAPYLDFGVATGIPGSSSDFKPNEEGKSQLLAALGNPSLESSQTPSLAEAAASAMLSSEPIGNTINSEMQNSPKLYPIQNDISAGGFNSTPITSLSLNMFDGGVIQSEPFGLGTEGSGGTKNVHSDFKDSTAPSQP